MSRWPFFYWVNKYYIYYKMRCTWIEIFKLNRLLILKYFFHKDLKKKDAFSATEPKSNELLESSSARRKNFKFNKKHFHSYRCEFVSWTIDKQNRTNWCCIIFLNREEISIVTDQQWMMHHPRIWFTHHKAICKHPM